MKRPQTKGDRLHNRELSIKAADRYAQQVLRMALTPRQLAIKAKHPKCDCWMCKLGNRDERNKRLEMLAKAAEE